MSALLMLPVNDVGWLVYFNVLFLKKEQSVFLSYLLICRQHRTRSYLWIFLHLSTPRIQRVMQSCY